jgi:hypothetical protein
VNEPADLAHEVLVRVAEFVRKLPADQLADLASGDAKLELVPRGGRRATPAKVVTLPRPAHEIRDTMVGIGERTAARRYLEVDLKLTVAQLRQLVADLGLAVSGTKPKLLDGVVEWAVGRSADSDAISRAYGGR